MCTADVESKSNFNLDNVRATQNELQVQIVSLEETIARLKKDPPRGAAVVRLRFSRVSDLHMHLDMILGVFVNICMVTITINDEYANDRHR